MPDLEAVLTCSHCAGCGKCDGGYRTCHVCDGSGGRRVRLVEVQPDTEAAESLFDGDLAWVVDAAPQLAIDALVRRVVDAAVPGLTYRLEEVE